MCGIAAIFDRTGPDPDQGERMLGRLVHRGPDDHGRHRGETFWLGHTRLSIVDLDGGRQPMRDGGWSLVCNGEIYNHVRLRDELGDVFTTSSDSEAALAMLRLHGPEGLSRLQGMWALCAATDTTFVAARDRIGIKPLYWARTGTAVHFASELRAFDPDVQAAAETFPPGCYWTPETGLVRFAPAVPPTRTGEWEPESAEKATRDVLTDSVRRHLMADVEVGVFLSGGLDSSIVAAIAADRTDRLKTFAVGTADSPDLLAAREVAAYLGTDHREAIFDAERARAALPDVVASVESFDASLIRSAVPNWFLARLAAEHVKVVLTGEGADELFAGYEYYHQDHADDLAPELAKAVAELHGLNLQRCDRVTMAHGLEARVPFLDAKVIAHAMSLPPELKALEGGVEKAHLRRAFTGRLPEHLLWRRKSQFGTGSGAQELLGGKADEPADHPGVRNQEELTYYRLFREALPTVRPEAVLTRFATP